MRGRKNSAEVQTKLLANGANGNFAFDRPHVCFCLRFQQRQLQYRSLSPAHYFCIQNSFYKNQEILIEAGYCQILAFFEPEMF